MKKTKNNLNIPLEILKLNITNTQKFILATLYQLLKKESEIHVSLKDLSDLVDCSRTSIINSLKLFQKNKWIVLRQSDDFGIYEILIDNSYYMNRKLSLYELQNNEKHRRNIKEFTGLHIDYNILHNMKLSPTDKIVLSYISNFAKKDKECFTKTDKICEILHISNREYLKSLKKLKELKLIDSEITRKNNKISGRKIKANLDSINNFYVEVVKEVKLIKEANIEVVEEAKIENVNNLNITTFNKLSDELLESLNREQLYNLYKENQKEAERLKHFINKESE